MSTKVLIAHLPRLLLDIVTNLLSTEPDIELVGTDIPESALPEQVAALRPDVVILVCDAQDVERVACGVLGVVGLSRVLAVTDGARQAHLVEVQPRLIALGEASRSTLLAAIRGTPLADGHT